MIQPSGLLREDGDSSIDSDERFYTEIADYGLGSTSFDEFRIEFWFGDDWDLGVHDLGTAINVQYETCRQCVRVFEDAGPQTVGQAYFIGTQYLAAEGLITVEEDPFDGETTVTLEGVRLVEIVFDENNGDFSIPVEGGNCLLIPDGVYATPPVPKEWTCTTEAFTDVTCDCGCGAFDEFCPDAEFSSCSRCDDVGSCLCPDEKSCPRGASCIDGINERDPTSCL